MCAGRWSLACVLALLLAGCAREPAWQPVRFHAQGQPEALEDWNLLRVADGRLQLNEGVLPYALNTPLFSDHAHKLRTVWMPAGTPARYAPDAVFDFPVGTVLSKTFYYPREGERVLRSDDAAGDFAAGGLDLAQVRLVETRLLVRREEGWLALPYVWNPAQTQARLQRAGALVSLSLREAGGADMALAYQVPDQNQCAGCHATDLASRALAPIGPKARHLQREVVYPDGPADQLVRWVDAGYLQALPSAGVPRDAVWNDPAASLQARARAYLDVNCGHCHSAQGPAKTSGMWLDAGTGDPLRLGRCKLPIAAGKGTGGHAYGIAPGDPDASILLYRMRSQDPAVMMPELGRSLVDEEGVALIRDWIAAMPRHDCGA